MPDPIAWSVSWPYYLAALVGGYLLGAVPFGLVLTRLAGYGDIRRIGSGNIGATNVLRTGNKTLALATLILDSGKGAAAVLIALSWGPYTGMLAGIGALLGHLFPVWLGFRGGKGVATTLGTLLAFAPLAGLASCGAWLLTALIFRMSSLAALVALALAPVFAYLLVARPETVLPGMAGWDHPAVVLAAVAAVLCWAKHHANIRRLLAGTEPKIGGKGKAAATAEPTEPE